MIIEMIWVSMLMMAVGGGAIAAATLEPRKSSFDDTMKEILITPPKGGSAAKKPPVKYSEKDLLVALVIDEIRKNPSLWKNEEVHKNQWRRSYYETLADRQNKIVVRRNHCWNIGSDHVNDCWINEVRITGKDFLSIKEVFDQRALRAEVERLSQRRISRELKNEKTFSNTALLDYESRGSDEIEFLAKAAFEPVYCGRI